MTVRFTTTGTSDATLNGGPGPEPLLVRGKIAVDAWIASGCKPVSALEIDGARPKPGRSHP